MRFLNQEAPSDVVVPKADHAIVGVERAWFAGSNHLHEDGEQCAAACIRCPNTPCIRFRDDELAADLTFASTYSNDPRVCPFDAIGERGGRVEVDPELCTGCGLCVARCPASAIHIDEGVATVETATCEGTEVVPMPAGFDFAAFSAGLTALGKADRAWEIADTRELAEVTDSVIATLGEIASARDVLGLLVRNTFLALGCPARVGVTGDTNSRADLLVDLGDTLGIGELEQNSDLLDSARRVLADVAIAVGRGGVEIDMISPFVVCVILPNRRSDYYELVHDIACDLHFNVRTLSVPALLALLYLDVECIDVADRFAIDNENRSLRHDLADLAGDRLDTTALRLGPLK